MTDMTPHDDLDREFLAWLDDAAPRPTPRNLGVVLERTRGMRQRPGWSSLERWLPMTVISIPSASPPLRLAWLLLIGVLVVAMGAGVALLGSGVFTSTPPDDARPNTIAIPQGGAAVLAFATSSGDLFTIRADGSDRRQITSGPEQDNVPVWSPDGTRIAFRRIDGDTVSVAVVEAGGGVPSIVHTNDRGTTSGGCFPHAPAWSPDGEWLVFTADGCGEPAELLAAPADGSSPPTGFLEQGILASGPAWATSADDGTQIAFVGSGADAGTGVYVIDIPAGGRIGAEPRVSARLVSGDASEVDWSIGRWSPLTTPSWSPDGTMIATAAGDNDCVYPFSGSMDAYVMPADGSGPVLVTTSSDKEYNPLWSPDGRHLALQRIVEPSEWINRRPCTMAVWVTDADGANAHRLEVLGTDDSQPPLWSPDGTRIVGNTVDVIDDVEHYDMYIETIDGSSPVVYVDDVGFATWQPVVAPL
jgi:Tol biopolymer transport system component